MDKIKEYEWFFFLKKKHKCHKMLGERFVARLMLCVVEICLDYVDFKQLRF
jgi:hypothetical protein